MVKTISKISKNMAMKYILTSIAYLDDAPANFVLVFHHQDDDSAPVVRVAVKYKKAGTISCTASKVDVLEREDVVPTDEANRLFKNSALEAVTTLCKHDIERSALSEGSSNSQICTT